MNAPKVVIGIDVSADHLACASRPAQPALRRTYPNSHEGIAALLRAIAALPAPARVVCEATGNHHVRLQDALWADGVPCSVIQPRLMGAYAKLVGARNKTDETDAALLAQYGAERTPPPSVPPSPARRQVKQLTAARRGMVQARTRIKNQLSALARLSAPDPTCLREWKRMLANTERSIARLDAARREVIAAEYAEEVALLESVTGIGPETAAALVAYAGDLSGFSSPRKLVALLGTAPRRERSGTSLWANGPITKQGNATLRTLFFMGAQTARKHNAACRALYERLIAKGKKPKQALIAVANKLARQAWAVLHHRQPYVDGFGLSP
jgi:transposase